MQQFVQQLINGLSWGAIYALIAVGYTMVYGVLRLINFAHGDVFMVGAMVSLYAATHWFVAPLAHGEAVGWVAAIAAAGGLALLAGGWFLLEHFERVGGKRRGRGRTVAMVMAGLLAAVVLAACARRWFRPATEHSWVLFIAIIVAAMVLAGLLGFVIEFVAYRPLRNQPRINALITAIGVSMLLEFGGQNPHVFGASPQAFPTEIVPKLLPGTPADPTHLLTLGGKHVELVGTAANVWWLGRAGDRREVSVGAIDLLIIGVTLVLMVALRFIVLRTKIGLALRAVSFRFDTAALMGINVNRVVSFTFVLGSSLAGTAGVLYAASHPKLDPFMGLIPGVKAFVAAVLGGIGNIAGAVVGGLLLGLIETLVAGYLPNGSQYKDAIAFAILIVVLLLKPTGLFGRAAAEKV